MKCSILKSLNYSTFSGRSFPTWDSSRHDILWSWLARADDQVRNLPISIVCFSGQYIFQILFDRIGCAFYLFHGIWRISGYKLATTIFCFRLQGYHGAFQFFRLLTQATKFTNLRRGCCWHRTHQHGYGCAHMKHEVPTARSLNLRMTSSAMFPRSSSFENRSWQIQPVSVHVIVLNWWIMELSLIINWISFVPESRMTCWCDSSSCVIRTWVTVLR